MQLDGRPLAGVVFDAYGTLLDVTSVANTCTAIAPDGAAFAALWRAKQIEYTYLRTLMDRYVDFWQVTADALDFTLARFGLAAAPETRERLRAAWLDLAPYPEAAAALQALSARPLAVLSNGSPVMLETVLVRAGLRGYLAHVLSVDEVEVYKPSPRVYALGPRYLHAAPDALLFVSGNAWDAAGAASYGYRVALLNRAGAPFDQLGASPALVVSDLQQLAARLSP